jgi:hypothetical protein
MAKDRTDRSSQDALAREVDRLLRQLPGGDPTKTVDPDLEQSKAAPRPGGVASGATGKKEVPAPSMRAQKVGVWLRALLATGLAVAVSQWPYAMECGWTLYLFMGVIGAVMIAGGWASVWSWRVRIAPAHLLSLIVVYWGIVLAAEQILPRIGYAPEHKQ